MTFETNTIEICTQTRSNSRMVPYGCEAARSFFATRKVGQLIGARISRTEALNDQITAW
jgi:hypothetical protein